MTSSLLNVLTQIDVTGPNLDVTTLIPNRPLDKRGSGDSEYRDSLTRSLKESSRRNLNTERRRFSDSESIRNDQSIKRTFGNQSSNTELKRENVSKTPNNRSSLGTTPLKEDQSDYAIVKPDDDSESLENVTLTDVGEIDSGEESDVLEGEQFFKIQAVIGLPPAQFQPFIVTTTLDDDVTTEIEGEETSNSLSEGRAHARSVIDNLIDRFEISPNQGQLHVSETLIPPAGLFQALKSLDKHEGSSEKPTEINSELKVEITIDPNTETASLIDSVEFEVTPADVSVETDAIVSTRQPESDTTYQVEVTQDLTFESGFIESDFIGVQPQKTAKGNSEGDDSGLKLSQPQLGLESAILEGRTDNTQVITAKTAKPTNETGPSVSTGSSQVQLQNSSDLAVGEIAEKDLTGKIKSSTKQTTTRSEVNLKNLVNRVAAAIRSAGRNGRQLRIRLQPPELGTLEIEVSSRNGVLSARLEVQTASAQQAILENMSLLRGALAQNGTRLENIDVHLNERLDEGRQADLSKEQQQDEQQSEQERQQDDSDQSPDENESESRQQAVGLTTQIDQLDIQI